MPAAMPHHLIPPGVGLEHGVSRVLGPMQKVVGGGQTDPLDRTLFSAVDASVKHVPAAVVVDHAAGPGGQVVPASGRPGWRASGRTRQSRRSRETAWPMVALWWRRPGSPEGAGRLQIEDMVLAVVAGKPEVPHPFVGQAERH